MEALSGVSSAFAVVSLAFQTAESIKKLCNFWRAVEDAPEAVREIIRDLNLLSEVLEDIGHEANSARPHSRSFALSLSVLTQCSENVQRLRGFLNSLEPGFASEKRRVRTWSAFKAAWKDDKIHKFQEMVRDLKATLLIARQTSINLSTVARQELQQNTLTLIADGMNTLLNCRTTGAVTTTTPVKMGLLEHIQALREEIHETALKISSPTARFCFEKAMISAIDRIYEGTIDPVSVELGEPPLGDFSGRGESRRRSYQKPYSKSVSQISSFLGIVRFSSSSLQVASGDLREANEASNMVRFQTQTYFSFHPSGWLQTWGLDFGIQVKVTKSFSGLDYSLRTYRAVPDEAPVFRYSRDGNVDGIRALFDEHLASPWDVNSTGLTPLFIAAQSGNVDTCKLLIAQGADIDALNFANDSIPLFACLTQHTYIGSVKVKLNNSKSCREHIDVIRLFLEQLDFDEDINCSGLKGIRRLTTKRCSDSGCSHSPNYPAALHWALPLLKSQLPPGISSGGRILAQLCQIAIATDDHDTLSKIAQYAGDINHKSITAWFSPAHYLCLVLWTPARRESLRILIRKGLDLHLFADDNFSLSIYFKYVKGETPTSLAIRYSAIFCSFREILFQLNIDISDFIRRELHVGPLAGLGWTFNKLHILFSLTIEPLNMPEITCQVCKDPDGYATEASWQDTLDALRAGEESVNRDTAEALLRLRDERIGMGHDIQRRICCYC